MELAALALLVCIGQIIDPAKDDVEFRHRIMNPLTEDEFQQLIAPWIDMVSTLITQNIPLCRPKVSKQMM